MKFLFLLIAALLALANADVSHLVNQGASSGYHYQNPPLSSYGVPQASVLGQRVSSLSLPSLSGPSVEFNNGFSTASPVAVTVHGYNGFSTPAPTFQVSTPAPSVDLSSFSTPAPSVGFSNFQVSTPAPNVDLSGFVSTPAPTGPVNLVQYSQPSSSYQFLSKLSQPPSFSVPSAAGFPFGSSSANVFAGQTSGGNLNDAFGVVTDAAVGHDVAEADVSKNLYFFAAPEEPEEEIQARVELPPVPPKKSYKIIFIKAPAYRNPASITIPAPPQNDEKTLVYVLVKKPDGQPKVKFQSAAPVQPSKPEVFFIKYKTQKEAEAAVAEIQSKHGASGHVIANLPAGAIQPEGALSVSSTPSSVGFGGGDLGSLNSFVTVSSTPSAPLGFGSSDVGFVAASSTPAPLGFSSSDVGSLNSFVSVSSTPAPLSFASNDVGSLNNFVTVSSTPAPLSFGGSPLGSGLSFDSLGANSFVSSTPAPVSFASSVPQVVFDQGVQSTTEAPVAEEGGADEVSDGSHASEGVVEQKSGEQAAGFTSYGPPKY